MKKFRRISLLVIGLLMVSTQFLMAQERTINGKVTDQAGEPLPGVTVLVEGTQVGTVTDVDGDYSLDVPAERDTLVFSFVGMQTQRVPIQGRTSISVTMVSQAQEMEQVVVVGYGTQKKQNLTGSVSSVDVGDLADASAPNTSSLLQGKMPGVTVQSFANQPGKNDPQIRIRGIRSFNSNNPMVIIDGVKSSISTLSKIPAEDIQDISVLKDAASASIYGVRAANGVILVETKGGTVSKPEFTVKQDVSWQAPVFRPDYLESWEWAEIQNVVNRETGEEIDYTDDMIAKMKNDDPTDGFVNTNWFNELMRTAPMTNTYIRAAGGTENAKYHISANYKNQDGIVIQTANKKYSFRSNVTLDMSEKLQMGLNVFGYKQRIDEPAGINAGDPNDFENSLMYNARRFSRPTVPVKYPDGQWGITDGAYGNTHNMTIKNVVRDAHTGERYIENSHMEGKLFADYELVKNLHFRSRFTFQYHNNLISNFTPTALYYDYNGNVINQDVKNNVSNNNAKDIEYANENLLRYNTSLGNHNIELLGGYSLEYHRNDHFWAYVENLPNNNIHELGAGVENKNVDGGAWETALQSYFTRAQYNYKEKYMFEFNLRRDGSSRMPEENRFSVFPSFSGGWVLSKESFMQDISFLSFFKIRGSWGKLGNQEIGRYPYSQTISTGMDYIWGSSLLPGVAVTNLANDAIKWEATEMLNIGLDMNLFENRLQITGDYFKKHTTDILMQLPIPGTVGELGAPYQNAGIVDNYGWELNVNYKESLDNFRYNAGFNLSSVKNEIVDLAGQEEIIGGQTINRVGDPMNAFYGYIAQGLFQSQEEIDDHADQSGLGGAPRPGDVKYKDISGPDGEPDGVITPEHDRKIIGKQFPDLTYSFNLGGGYKGINIRAFFQGITGVKRLYWLNSSGMGAGLETWKDYWREDNRDAEFPRFGNQNHNNKTSTFWLRDASYLRLKNLEIGYTFPDNMLESIGLSNLRVYFSGYNLLTWSDVEDFDPEKFASDYRNSQYPNSKVYTVGINVSFK